MTLFDPEAAVVAAPEPPVARVRGTVAYDGSSFHGFAAQASGVRTVGGELTAALAKVLGHPVELAVAGRTDKGVHAWGQVVSFDARAEGLDLLGLQRSCNKMLGPAVVVRELVEADPEFHARFSARLRRYRYTVLNREVPDPFLARTSWHVAEPLDLRSMQLACDPIIGEHDFAAFCRRPTDQSGMVRRVTAAQWLDLGDGVLRFDIDGTAFCHQMVRSLVGTMVAVGAGRKKAGEMTGILRGRDRSSAGAPAPPHGLCLWDVCY